MTCFVPPARVQRIWYLFKRQHSLEMKSSQETSDMHCYDFDGLAGLAGKKRRAILRAIPEIDQPSRDWINRKIDRMMGVYGGPKRVMGV